AERPVGGGGGRRHAEAAVVVDLTGAERDAGELAEQVRLLVGEPAPAEHGHAVGAVFAPDGGQPVGDVVERHVPVHRAAVQERAGQAGAVGEEFGGGPALLAEGSGGVG